MSLTYAWLYSKVKQRFASASALEDYLPQPLSSQELAQLDDSRYLSALTRRVFQAGMRHSVVNAKWPEFEQAFWGFDPEKMVLLSPEQLENFMHNPKLIRHLTKLRSIPHNAQLVLDIRHKYGISFAEFIANWPSNQIVDLWQLLAKQGSRLGGRSAASFLRLIGKDTFLTTSDVIGRLQAAGLVTREPKTKAELAAIQAIFNRLQAESGRPLCQISALLSLSINPQPLHFES